MYEDTVVTVRDGNKRWRIIKDKSLNTYWLQLMVIDEDMEWRTQDNGTLKDMLRGLETSIGFSAVALT